MGKTIRHNNGINGNDSHGPKTKQLQKGEKSLGLSKNKQAMKKHFPQRSWAIPHEDHAKKGQKI